MLMWIVIISLLLIGLILLIVEVVFIPGTTVVGLLGVAFSIIGVVAGYNQFGQTVGFYLLMSTLVITAIALFFSFRSGMWQMFSLQSTITSKVNEGKHASLTVGDTGITTSTLKPSGKAEFKNEVFEVRSTGNYVEPQTKVKIVSIDIQQIIVEPTNS
jgi:membrane-bound ClpP family serine protease